MISELLSLTPTDDDNNDEFEAEGEESTEAKQVRLNDERRKEEIVTNLLNGAINARESSLRDDNKTTLREALKTEDLQPSTVSRLASSLARLMMPSRYSTSSSSLTDNDHGDDDCDGGDAALTRTKATVSSLSMNSALLYAELLGTDGAWTSGFVDISGIIAIRALLRRWCVEGIRNGSFVELKKKNRGRPPAKKRSKAAMKANIEGSRKSIRISQLMMNDENDSDYDDDDVGDDGNDNNVELAAKNAAILGGPRLALALGRASQNTEYSHWSAEAREFYVDAACVALGMCAALLSMSGGCDNNNVNKVCNDALASLEHALRTTIILSTKTTPVTTRSRSTSRTRTGRRSDSSGNINEKVAREQRMRESGLHFLRGLLPLFHLKLEVPNGHAGKLAAYETSAALLMSVISSLSEMSDLEELPVIRGRPSVVSGIEDTSSATPKRGGRKSVGFAHTPVRISTPGITPDSSDDFLVPPSLKKSITPRLTRSASLRLSDQSNIRLQHRHPILILVVGLCQRLLTTGGLEKANARSRACNFGIRCLENLPIYEQGKLHHFVKHMCESKISCHRLLGVELIGQVLCMGWFWRDTEKNTFVKTPGVVRMSERSSEASTSSTLLEALQGRLSDKSPTVRTRAAQSIGQVVEKACTASEARRNLDGTMIAETPNKSVPSRALVVALSTIGPSLVEVVRKRASTDDSAMVRKCSIIAWLQLLKLAQRERRTEFVVSGHDVAALCRLCNDASVATRKAAADALTSLVQANSNGEEDYSTLASSLEIAWAQTVLPLVADAEATCVTKAVEFFSSLVIEPIIEEDGSAENQVAWRILSKLSDGSKKAGGSRNASGSLVLALQKLLINAGNDSKALATKLLRAIYNAIRTSLCIDTSMTNSTMSTENEVEVDLFDISIIEMRTGSWCLLDALTSCLSAGDYDNSRQTSLTNLSLHQAVGASKIDSSFLTSSLRKLRGLMNSNDVLSESKINLIATSRYCMKVISKMGNCIPLDDAEVCFAELKSDLESFSIPVELISATINALITITKRICDASEKDVFGEVKDWVISLLKLCEHTIDSRLSAITQRGVVADDDEQLLATVLFFIGELSLVGFTSQEESSILSTKPNSEVTPTSRDPVRGLLIRPSARLLHLVKMMLPSSLPMAADEELTLTSTSVRAHAFITLGKVCLRDECLAKESLTILARELHNDSESHPAVLSNCLMVMGDLCVRYTNLVDKYLPFMAASLQAGDGKAVKVNDSSRLSLSFSRHSNAYSIVKKNAIMLITSLLLQDYIKWRGLLIHRFLAAVSDEDDEVAQLAQTALRGPLLQKQPSLFSSHFVGVVFVFNNCKAHPIYTAEASGGGGGVTVDFEGASLIGSSGYHKRREVYEMMLSSMTDEQKLEVTARLVKDVLGGALETSGDLSAVCKLSAYGIQNSTKLSHERIEAATNVITDTLDILTSSKTQVGRKGAEDSDDDLGTTTSNSRPEQRNSHKQRLLGKISRKHLMEIIMPILCNLKSILESSHSPLIKNTMKYLLHIFRNYKSEVREYLANQPTLLQELEYDLRVYEKEAKKRGKVSFEPSEFVTDDDAI